MWGHSLQWRRMYPTVKKPTFFSPKKPKIVRCIQQNGKSAVYIGCIRKRTKGNKWQLLNSLLCFKLKSVRPVFYFCCIPPFFPNYIRCDNKEWPHCEASRFVEKPNLSLTVWVRSREETVSVSLLCQFISTCFFS